MSQTPAGIDLAPDPMCGVAGGAVQWANARWAQVFGPVAGGAPLADVVHPDDLPAGTHWLANPDPSVPCIVLRIAATDGQWVDAECTARPAGDGLVVMAARTGARVAPAIRFAPVATSSAVRAVLEAGDVDAALAVIAAAVDDFHPGASIEFLPGAAGDVALVHAPDETVCLPVHAGDAHVGLLVVHVPPAAGAPPIAHADPDLLLPRLENVVVALGEVADRERLSARATTDALTGLPNRPALEAAATRELALRAGRAGGMGLLMIDLDHFKEINDTLGHQAGDAVLVAVAALMHQAVRSGDMVARLGGDEFAVLLPGCDAGSLAAVANRLATAVGDAPDHVRHGATASVGAVLVTGAGVTWDDAYVAADATLYRAKQAGRNQVVMGPLDLGAG